MKKVVILIGMLLFLPLISSQIIITQQPETVYNLGDLVTVASTLKYNKNVAGIFQMDLICAGSSENFYKNGVVLAPGEEKKIEASLILTQEIIGNMKGDCVIKSFLVDDSALTNHFEISDSITISATFDTLEFSPGDTVSVSGEAIKENGEDANGFIQLSIIEDSSTVLNQIESISNGIFTVGLSLPEDMKAGS